MNINHINEIVSDYILNREVQGAIFINGKWGSGKTFYWKHTLSPRIENTKYDGRSNYKTIYVSLNGLTNVRSITSQILSSVLGITKRGKIAKTFFKVAESIPKVIEKHTIGTEFSQEIYSTIDIVDLMDFSNAVLCFDDLERTGGNLNVEDVLGYINLKFVEHNGIRTIILGDENNIKYSKNDEVKEKIFYREIKFELGIDDIISILKDRYEQLSKPFASIIRDNSNFIKEVIERCELTNLRSILFAFDNLKIFYDCLEAELFNQIGNSLINFTLILTSEFKSNKVNATNMYSEEKLEIYQNNPITSSILAKQLRNSDVKGPIPDSVKYYEKFIKKSPILYNFFNSVYKTIITGYFDVEQFKSEITLFVGSEEKKLLSRFWNYQELSNEEFDKLMEQLIHLIGEGKIGIYQYPSIYERFMNFCNSGILKYKIEELDKIFIEGIQKANKIEKYYDENAFIHGNVIRDAYKTSQILSEYVRQFQSGIKEKQKKERIENLYNILSSDDIQSEKDSFIHIGDKFEPIFDILSVDKLIGALIKCSNRNLYKFIIFIESKYKDTGNFTSYLQNEEPYLRDLRKKLETVLSSIEEKSLHTFLLRELIEVLGQRLKLFELYQKQQKTDS